MKLSIITVNYNDAPGLMRTFQSIKCQSCQDFEYIVVDGGSSDDSLSVIQVADCKISKWVSEPDEGIYNAMNKGVRMCTGDYCIFMNAGDTFHDGEVIRQVYDLLGKYDLYVGATTVVEAGKSEMFQAPFPMSVEHLLRTSIFHQSTFIRTSLLRKCPYREDLKVVSDWAFFFMQWLEGATYMPLPFCVSDYYLGGFSYQHRDIIDQERKQVIDEFFGMRSRDPLFKYIFEGGSLTTINESYEQNRIRKTMLKPTLQRDLNLIRYGFKFLFKDLINKKW